MKQGSVNIGHFFIISASVVIVLAGTKMASVIIVPFLLALFMATILSPFFLWLKKIGLGEVFALIIIVLLLFLIIVLMVTLVGNSVQDFSQNIPAYEIKLRNDLSHFFDILDKWGLHIPKEDFVNLFQTGNIMRFTANTLKSLGSLLTNSFLIILTIIFMLMEISQFTAKIEQTNSGSLIQFIEISDKIKHYILLKAATSAVTGISIAIILNIFGIHYAILWGLIAFTLNFIPSIGSIIAAVPAIIMAIVQYNFTVAFFVMIAYLFINILIGSIIEPRILGRGLGLSTLVVFLSLIFWGWLLGPIGMLLSVPLTIMIKIALDTQPNTRWIATLLSSGGDIKAVSKREV
ncbi:MAG: AI-2E family transporter [Campylobacterota bacterium]|nr:AI-2E family transporter [Campylobacterota bacterium]